jgi:hypothetical protein
LAERHTGNSGRAVAVKSQQKNIPRGRCQDHNDGLFHSIAHAADHLRIATHAPDRTLCVFYEQRVENVDAIDNRQVRTGGDSWPGSHADNTILLQAARTLEADDGVPRLVTKATVNRQPSAATVEQLLQHADGWQMVRFEQQRIVGHVSSQWKYISRVFELSNE